MTRICAPWQCDKWRCSNVPGTRHGRKGTAGQEDGEEHVSLASICATNASCSMSGVHDSNPAFVSPTDNLMTPCTKKLSAAKKKNFAKCVHSLSYILRRCSDTICRGSAKPMPSLFSQQETKESESSGDESNQAKKTDDDDGNPF